MADSILQMYASTLGSGTTNSAAFVDIPQRARLRKVQFMPIIRGITTTGGGQDFSWWCEISTLPTNRMFNNGDYGNIYARAAHSTEGGVTTSGASAVVIAPTYEVTGLDFRVEVGLRIFMHVYMSATPASQDEWVVNLYMDA